MSKLNACKNQKQPFADVLQNRCSEKFRKSYRKTPVLESFLNKVAEPAKHVTLIKGDSNTDVFMRNLQNF